MIMYYTFSICHGRIEHNFKYNMKGRKLNLSSDCELRKDTPYLALVGELWGVFPQFFGGKKYCNVLRGHCITFLKLIMPFKMTNDTSGFFIAFQWQCVMHLNAYFKGSSIGWWINIATAMMILMTARMSMMTAKCASYQLISYVWFLYDFFKAGL